VVASGDTAEAFTKTGLHLLTTVVNPSTAQILVTVLCARAEEDGEPLVDEFCDPTRQGCTGEVLLGESGAPVPVHRFADEPTNHQPVITNRVFKTIGSSNNFEIEFLPSTGKFITTWWLGEMTSVPGQTETRLLPRNHNNTLARQGLHRIVKQVSKQLVGNLPEDHNLLLVCPPPRLLSPLVVGFEESVDHGAVRLGTVEGLTQGFEGRGVRVRGDGAWRDSRAAMRTRRKRRRAPWVSRQGVDKKRRGRRRRRRSRK
jgi:hypothetical protein